MAKTKESTSKEYVSYYIDLKDSDKSSKQNASSKFAWRAPEDAYPNDVAKELGVVKATNSEVGLIYGMNNPRPVRVRINVKLKQGESKSVVLFCSPAKISGLLIGNTLRGKNFKTGKITTVSAVGSSTNPHRSKKSKKTSKPTTKNKVVPKPKPKPKPRIR